MSLYSSFFSSGLLAPRTPTRVPSVSDLSDDSEGSPSCPSSPIPLPDDYAMELDDQALVQADLSDPESRRSLTPTPPSRQPTPVASPQAVKGSSRNVRPRVRRRRSSLTQATSPIRTIRSPTRAAENAFNLQLHLPTSMSRSRSGSLHGGIIGMATEETSLVGRLRSGSCSNVSINAPSRSHRLGRRLSSRVVPAAAPPPTVPLPALPLTPLEHSTQHNLRLNFAHPILNYNATSMKSPTPTSACARGLSVRKLSGGENRIDEETKEN